jgi:teichuronic acid biosynthesis glycosyltransferase TuaC
MDLIVLSNMYPNRYSPLSGNFIEEQIKSLNYLLIDNLNIIVISPIPWSPRFLWFKKRWREYGQTEKHAVREGIKVYYPRYFIIPGKFFSIFHGFSIYLSVKSLIKKLLKKNRNLTILHTHTIIPGGLAGTLLKQKFNIPHICTIHGSDINIAPFQNRFSFLLTKYSLRKCDHIIVVSNKLKERTLSISNKINSISVIYNGADPKKFKYLSKDIAKQRLGLTINEKIILYIGNLISIKGVNNLIKAFEKLINNKKVENIVLFLIGEGNKKHELIKLVNTLRIENKVFFLGEKDNNEIPLWLNIADIFVLPSLSEGFPLVIPEAMMCGVPIVATDVGGVSEAIIDRYTGLLVKPNDINSLAKAIYCYLDNKQLAQYIIENAKKMSENFTWEKNAESNLTIYKMLLNYQNSNGHCM